MKKAALPAALVLVAAGIVGGIVAFMGGEYRLADKAPQDTTLWFEAQNLKGSWAQFKKSEAWKDFEGSKSFSELSKGWEQLVELANTDKHMKELAEVGLALNEANVLNFVGQNVAVGVIAGDGSGPPATYAMTRIDVIGLAKEIAVQGDWRKVWEKLQNALGGKDVKVTSYKGYDIATRTFPVPTKSKEWSIHFSMIEDTLVVSHSQDVVKSIIDVAKGDAKSLNQLPAFSDEVDALSRSKVAYGWANVGLVRDKERVTAIVQAAGKAIEAESGQKGPAELAKKFTGKELDVLIDDLSPDVAGLAVGLNAPGANPYRAYFAGSRASEEVFKDSTHTDVRCIAGDDTMFLFEAKNLFDLAVRFMNSKTAQRLQETEAWTWLRKKLEDPNALSGVGPGVPMKENPLFELRTGVAFAQAVLKELLGESVAVVIGTADKKKLTDAIRPALYYRPRPVVRLAADLALGVAAAHSDMTKTTRADEGKYPAFQIKPDKNSPTVHVARIGGDFLVTTQADIVKSSVAKAGAKGTFASEELKSTLGKVPTGYQAVVYVDYARYGPLFKGLMRDLGGRGMKKDPAAEKSIELINKIYGPAAEAFYVSDDFTTWSVQGYQAHAPNADPRFKKLMVNAADAPGLWKLMPEDTFASYTLGCDPASVYEYMFDLFKGMAPKKQFERSHQELVKALGKDPKELVGFLGGELGVALTVQDKLPPSGMPAEQAEMVVAVPAALVYCELKDAAGFKQEVIPLLKKAIKKLNAERAGGKGKQVVAALKEIANAQALFREGDKDGDGKPDFATRLRDLGKAGLISPMLASGFHLGYRFKLQRTPKDKGEFTWMCVASPFMGEKGEHFAVTHEGVVYHSLKAFELTETCTVPKDAVPVGKPIPGAPVKKKDPNDPSLFRLAESTLSGATVWELLPPQKDQRQLGMVGEGVKPCFAITDTHLIVSTSRTALQRSLDAANGTSLATSSAFKERIKGQPTDVALFMHFFVDGVLEQLKRNSRLMASQLASPPSSELKKPQMPEWNAKLSPKEYDAQFAQYRKDRAAYREKVTKWRKDHLDENAATLERILDSLRVLGGMVGWSKNTPDGKAVEGRFEWKLDLSAVKPAAKQ